MCGWDDSGFRELKDLNRTPFDQRDFVDFVRQLKCWERGKWRVQEERRGWLNGNVSFILFFLEVLITLVHCAVSRSIAYKYCLSGPLIALKLLLRFW